MLLSSIQKYWDKLSLICPCGDLSAVRRTGSDVCHRARQNQSFGSTSVIHAPTNAAFRFPPNLLSTALLAKVLFNLCFHFYTCILSRQHAQISSQGTRGQPGLSEKGYYSKIFKYELPTRAQISVKELIKQRGQQRTSWDPELRTASLLVSLRGTRAACITDWLQSLWSSIKNGLVAWRR